MGTKVVYNRDSPPYGNVYEYDKPVLAIVARRGNIHVRRLHGGSDFPIVPERPTTFVLEAGFYHATYNHLNGGSTKAYIYVSDRGEVLQFKTLQQLKKAYREYERGGTEWAEGSEWLAKDGEEPPRRKFMRDPFTRFDRIDRDIVPEKPVIPKPKGVMAAEPEDETPFDAILNDAMEQKEIDEIKKEKAEQVRRADPMNCLVDEFLKDL